MQSQTEQIKLHNRILWNWRYHIHLFSSRQIFGLLAAINVWTISPVILCTNSSAFVSGISISELATNWPNEWNLLWVGCFRLPAVPPAPLVLPMWRDWCDADSSDSDSRSMVEWLPPRADVPPLPFVRLGRWSACREFKFRMFKFMRLIGCGGSIKVGSRFIGSLCWTGSFLRSFSSASSLPSLKMVENARPTKQKQKKKK